MPRLDVHPMPGDRVGYVVSVQSDLLTDLVTRVVVPLLPLDQSPRPITGLNPVFEIGGQAHVLLTQAVVSVPVRALKRPLASLDAHHDQITRALDILLIGI